MRVAIRFERRARRDVAARRRAEMVARMRHAGPVWVGVARRRCGVGCPQERCDLCRTTMPDDHRHMLHLESSGGSSARARRAGRFTPATPSTGRRGCGSCGSTASSAATRCGRSSRSRSGSRSSCAARSPTAWSRSIPSPAGATESELTLEAWEALVAANPVTRAARARCRGAGRQPPVRPARVRDRADRPVLRARRADQVALGGDLRRRRDRARGARVLRRDPGAIRARLRGAAMSTELDPARLRRRWRPSPSSRSPAPHTWPSRRRRRCCSPRPSTDPSGHEIQSIALTVQVMIDPARRGYDPETRERLAELFGPPACWAPSTSGLAWARVSAAVPAFRARRRSRSRSPAPTTSRSRRRSTSTRVEDGEIPLSFHFNGNVFYRDGRGPAPGDAGALEQHRPVPDAGLGLARDDRGALPRRRLDPAQRARRSRRSTGAARSAGLPSFDACVSELLESDVTSWSTARLLAAVRGLRAVSVHARRDQERDPDAVRDRLPARLRGRVRRARSTTRGWSA